MNHIADLSPPLGWPGGPCHVVERIEDKVRSQGVRDKLVEKVEHGQKLTNPEASKIYHLEMDRGGGLFRTMQITSHAQYRMDQRGITVGDLRVALKHYSKQLLDWKSQRSWQWADFERSSRAGTPVEWNDKQIGDLRVVLVNDRGSAVIITSYWVGLPDPKPESCKIARSDADLSGYRTFVKDPSPSRSDTGKPQGERGKYPNQGLPSPPWARSKPTRGPTVLNVPGESGSDSSGNIHKDKARTQGVPGGQYPGGKTHPDTPYNNTGITPQRRPGMTADDGFDEMLIEAGMYPPSYPSGAKRQRKQKSRAYRYFHKRYKRKRGPTIRRQKIRHKRLKNNRRYRADRQRRKDKPERFLRKPSGGATSVAERSQKQRDKKKNTPGKNRQDTRPKRGSQPISFYHYPSGLWGDVLEVDVQGVIHFELEDQTFGKAEFDDFFEHVVLDENELGALFAYMDAVFEFSGGVDDIGEEGEDADPAFDSWLSQAGIEAVAKLADEVLGSFYREVRAPAMDSETVYDRANDHDQRSRRDRKPGTPGLNGPHEKEVHDSNPGSRVYPSGKDHMEKRAQFQFRSLPRERRQGLVDLLRSPLWEGFQRGVVSGQKVLLFLQAHGWESLSKAGMWELFNQVAEAKLASRTAALIRDIREGCGSEIQSRSEGLKVRLARVDAKNAVWLFNVEGSKSPYRVRLKAAHKGNVRDLQKMHVKVSCSCPFWRWQGPEHWAKQGDYLFGKPKGSASKPEVKDPNGLHRACKHILAVFSHVVGNKWQMSRPQRQAARYLADRIRLGEVIIDHSEFDKGCRRVAARYLASREV